MRRAGREMSGGGGGGPAPKEIVKEGLSEYFLYTIEGTETIPTGWAKRLPSFTAEEVPVTNLYKYDESRYGASVVRFLFFKNDEESRLGETPLPDGLYKVYRTVDEEGHLSYEGANNAKYIPVDQKAELNLGATTRVVVKPVLMDFREEKFSFDKNGNINGFERVETWSVEVKNTRPVPARVEITRKLRHDYWTLEDRKGEFGKYKKDDKTTIKFTLALEERSAKKFTYTVRFKEGERRNVR